MTQFNDVVGNTEIGTYPATKGGLFSNLVVENDATNPNFQLDITADSLDVENLRLESVNVGADITVSGAGGLDTGAEAANTWYNVFVISNDAGTTVNGLLSLSATAPTMPVGFTKKRRVGAVRNDGSSNFLSFVTEGNKVVYQNSQAVLSNGVATSYTDVDCSAVIPQTSRHGIFWCNLNPKHTTVAEVAFNSNVRTNGTSGTGLLTLTAHVNVANSRANNTLIGEVTTDASQIVEYQIDVVPDTDGGVNLSVNGYYDRI